MSELNPNLFQLDQVISTEDKILHLTSCPGKLQSVAIIKNSANYYLILISLTQNQDIFKTQWLSWFSDPLLIPQTLCFSTQNDLLLIGTCSGILCIIPTKLLLTENVTNSKKIRLVKPKDESEIARRAMPVSISWWATNESKALAILGTNHGFIIIVDLVDGKEIGHVKVSEKAIVKLDQVSDEANDNIYLFISDSSGKQWRQLLEQKSTGFTWCGANEVASHPKTPTLEKAANVTGNNVVISDKEEENLGKKDSFLN